MGKKTYACVTILPNRFVLVQHVQQKAILTLTSLINIDVPTSLPTRSALVLVTKDSFVSLVRNMDNKSNVCKQ